MNRRIGEAFAAAGLDPALAVASYSNRPDLSDLQCNGALQAARTLRRRPLEIAGDMRAALERTGLFSAVEVAGPGFVNLTLADGFVLDTLLRAGVDAPGQPAQTIVIDYGGPNVAKPLHVGHLRSAIIGEALKRTARALGHRVIGDIHLGDWGTPMGMLIARLESDHPEWPCFRDGFTPAVGAAPELSVEDLNSLYPLAAAQFKQDAAFAERARDATARLQAGHPGYRWLWRHFVSLSVDSIKRDFGALDVSFDVWLGESDAAVDADGVVDAMIAAGVARESQGALVVDVARAGDKHEIPPLILRKKDGADAYATTDIATIRQRVRDLRPDRILYVVDQRQQLHFVQVFRAAARAELIPEDRLEHIGFGTMNGRDGKPFKTRAGGVMRLADLIQSAVDAAWKEAGFGAARSDDAEMRDMIEKVAVAAIKFGDLSNARTSDYVFDLDELIRFDGKTGPYLQYAAVRADSVVEKADAASIVASAHPQVSAFAAPAERALALGLLGLPDALERAFERRMPSELCEYGHVLAQRFSAFYRDCPILAEPDPARRAFRLYLTRTTAETLKHALGCLGIPVPRRMLRAQSADDTPPPG